MPDKPSVLFVCVHNAGRSQMAAAWLTHLAGNRVEVRSAGSAPADTVNPAVVEAMREVGIDISAQIPKVLTIEAVQASDVCITMGCGDACPVFPGKRYLDWTLDDPAGQGITAVRPIRDEIKKLVEGLVTEITGTAWTRPPATPPQDDPMPDKPSVLFVCVHNAGRSQMATAWLTHLAGDRVEVRSAGSAPADTVNPAVIEAMHEVGIDIASETPKVLTIEAVQASDVCITMGCGDACPVFPGKRYLDWKLEDPAGQSTAAVRPIRDQIKGLVEELIAEIAPEAAS